MNSLAVVRALSFARQRFMNEHFYPKYRENRKVQVNKTWEKAVRCKAGNSP